MNIVSPALSPVLLHWSTQKKNFTWSSHRTCGRLYHNDLHHAFMEYFITPIYMGYPKEAVARLLLPVFLPFNLLKGGLNAAFTFLLYKPIVQALRKTGTVKTNDSKQPQNISV